jgi:benzoate 4-monooxygenase
MIGILLFQGVAITFLAYYILLPFIEYYKDPKKLRRFPSVSVAAFTDAWMVIQQYCYSRTVAVHRAHLKHGPIVRIGTSHISVASQQAIKNIYGHGTPATKDNFYKAYVGTHLNVSDSQDRGVHSHKRKRFAVAFAQKTITDLEYAVAEKLEKLMPRLDEYAHESSSTTSTGKQSEDSINLKAWIACLALDINGVLLFSHEFGFLDQGNTVTIAERIGGSTYRADVKMAISESNHISTSLAWAPRGLSLNRFLTGWHSGEEKRVSFFSFITDYMVGTDRPFRMETRRRSAGRHHPLHTRTLEARSRPGCSGRQTLRRLLLDPALGPKDSTALKSRVR